MKLTLGAFEAIYQACEPTERKKSFKNIASWENPGGAVLFVEVPAPKLEALMSGEQKVKVKLIAVADGCWEAG